MAFLTVSFPITEKPALKVFAFSQRTQVCRKDQNIFLTAWKILQKWKRKGKKKNKQKPVTTHAKEGLLAAIKFLNPIFTELSLSHFKQKKLMKHSHRISYMDFVTIGYSLSESSPPGGSEAKASLCNVGDLGSIPGSGRSPGEGNGNPLQHSCLENPMDVGAW